jgi:hypothetical protein
VIGLSGLRAQDLANKVVPGSGYVLAGLITLGGLVFCIGNLSATGQGLKNLFGLEPRIGVVLSAALAILIFSYKALDGTLDKAVIVLGTIKIGLIAYICVVTTPPVGGYITCAGAHRLIESGTTGPENLKSIARGSVNGILITGAAAAVPGHPRRRHRRCGAVQGGPGGLGVRRGRRTGRTGTVRPGLLDGGHDEHHRRLVHVRDVPEDARPARRAPVQPEHQRLHRDLDRAVPDRRADTRGAARVRRGVQRPDPAVRARHHAVDRVAPACLLQGATYPRWICWSAWRRGCSPSTPGSARWRTCP